MTSGPSDSGTPAPDNESSGAGPRETDKDTGGARKFRHRGPRRATGGTSASQGEPERLAGIAGSAPTLHGQSTSGSGSSKASGTAQPEDARSRWLREQRPPHWD